MCASGTACKMNPLDTISEVSHSTNVKQTWWPEPPSTTVKSEFADLGTQPVQWEDDTPTLHQVLSPNTITEVSHTVYVKQEFIAQQPLLKLASEFADCGAQPAEQDAMFGVCSTMLPNTIPEVSQTVCVKQEFIPPNPPLVFESESADLGSWPFHKADETPLCDEVGSIGQADTISEVNPVAFIKQEYILPDEPLATEIESGDLGTQPFKKEDDNHLCDKIGQLDDSPEGSHTVCIKQEVITPEPAPGFVNESNVLGLQPIQGEGGTPACNEVGSVWQLKANSLSAAVDLLTRVKTELSKADSKFMDPIQISIEIKNDHLFETLKCNNFRKSHHSKTNMESYICDQAIRPEINVTSGGGNDKNQILDQPGKLESKSGKDKMEEIGRRRRERRVLRHGEGKKAHRQGQIRKFGDAIVPEIGRREKSQDKESLLEADNVPGYDQTDFWSSAINVLTSVKTERDKDDPESVNSLENTFHIENEALLPSSICGQTLEGKNSVSSNFQCDIKEQSKYHPVSVRVKETEEEKRMRRREQQKNYYRQRKEAQRLWQIKKFGHVPPLKRGRPKKDGMTKS